MSSRRFVRPLAAAVLFAACSDQHPLAAPPTTGAYQLAVVSGGGQTGVAGSTLPAMIVARVTDAVGQPVSRAMVRFAVRGSVEDGGYFWAPGVGTASELTVPTDSAGLARISRVLGVRAGPQLAEASIKSAVPAIPERISILATATAGPAVRLGLEGPAGGEIPVTISRTETVGVIALDQWGNRVPDAPVSWIPGPAGSVAASRTVTDSTGKATVTWTIAPAGGELYGTYVLVARPGTSSPESFGGVTITRNAGNAFLQDVETVAAGLDFACAIGRTGQTRCWGDNSQAQLGNALPGWTPAATPLGSGPPFRTIVAGYRHACGLDQDGIAWCWGANQDGQVDGTSTGPRSSPTRVAGHRRFGALAAGARHTCGLTLDGEAWCWGSNYAGQLGSPDVLPEAPFPATQVRTSLRFARIAAGRDHTCAITFDGVLACWGDNSLRQTAFADSASIVRTPSVTTGAYLEVATGGGATCAKQVAGPVQCWGGRWWPVDTIPAPRLTQLAASEDQFCGLATDGRPHCWRTCQSESPYDCDIGLYEQAETLPVPSARRLAVGSRHGCVLSPLLRCWGENEVGQAGGLQPGRVTAPSPVTTEGVP